MDASTCPRHPDVETRLRCSACDSLICPNCGSEAAVGYKCPDCKAAEQSGAPEAAGSGVNPLAKLGSGLNLGGGRSSGKDRSTRPTRPTGEPPPMAINVRATVVGVAASVAGGLLMGPILIGGAFFLISAGVIGWLVARSVYWASEERNSPYLRAAALTLAGFAVAIGIAQASGMTTGVPEIAFLAFPAAVYGGWIVVRQR